MTTHATKSDEIKRSWHLVDAKEQILGRLATRVAALLMGKNKPYFTRSLDCGDFVVVVNAQKIQLSGKKERKKTYFHHSGYPGGFKEIPFSRMKAEHPERVIEHAVSGMLPDNKLKKGMLARLKIFIGEEHPYRDKIKNQTLNI